MASVRSFFQKWLSRLGKALRDFRLTRSLVVRGALFLLISIVAGTAVFRWNAQALVGDALPMPFGFGFASVLSGSMEPELSEGDLLVVVEKDAYYEREVVVFQDGRTLVTHRIIRIEGGEILTMGDANNSPDSPITKEQIKGKVILSIPFLGYLVEGIKSPLGTIFLLALALLLLRLSSRSDRRRAAEVEEDAERIRREIENLKQNGE